MLKVGLTGSIAVGKSYVVSVLAELGCVTLDADKVAHSVMEPGRPAYERTQEPGAARTTAPGDDHHPVHSPAP